MFTYNRRQLAQVRMQLQRYDAPCFPEPVSAGAGDINNGVTDKREGPVKMVSPMNTRKEGPIDCLIPAYEGLDFIFKPKETIEESEEANIPAYTPPEEAARASGGPVASNNVSRNNVRPMGLGLRPGGRFGRK